MQTWLESGEAWIVERLNRAWRSKMFRQFFFFASIAFVIALFFDLNPFAPITSFSNRIWTAGPTMILIALLYLFREWGLFNFLQNDETKQKTMIFLYFTPLLMVGTTPNLIFAYLFMAAIPIALMFLYDRKFLSVGWFFFLCYLSLLLASFAPVWRGVDLPFQHDRVWSLFVVDRLIMPISMIVLELRYRFQGFEGPVVSRRSLSLIYQPGNLIFALPTTHESLNRRTNDTRFGQNFWLGVKVVLFVLFDISLVEQLTRMNYSISFFSWRYFLIVGTLSYLNTFALTYYYMNIGMLFARAVKLDMPDPMNYALLATSPIDKWRRWNIYFYDWLFQFIYFPFVRVFKSHFWGIQAVFLGTFLLHEMRTSLLSLFPHDNFIDEWDIRSAFFFFAANGVFVYLGSYFPKKWQDAKSAAGWIGVTITLIGMILIHAIRI